MSLSGIGNKLSPGMARRFVIDSGFVKLDNPDEGNKLSKLYHSIKIKLKGWWYCVAALTQNVCAMTALGLILKY